MPRPHKCARGVLARGIPPDFPIFGNYILFIAKENNIILFNNVYRINRLKNAWHGAGLQPATPGFPDRLYQLGHLDPRIQTYGGF